MTDPDWRSRGLCVGKAELFFPQRGARPTKDIVELCGWCPVKRECGDDAQRFIELGEPLGGVWGDVRVTANGGRRKARAMSEA